MQENALSANTINYVPPIPTDVGKEKKEKFNFLEILVVISAFLVVGLLVLLAINPSKESATARNLERSADASTILSYVSSYAARTKTIPDAIPQTQTCVEYMNEICKTGPFDCTDLVDMDFLANGKQEELINMPMDPLHISINGTGYFIFNDGTGLITVCAPYAERNEVISFSKYLY
jgi:hypothetical protein